MMRRNIFVMMSLLMLVPMTALAQWRAGVHIGGDYNSYSRDVHYLSDYHYEGGNGFAINAMAQYDFLSWLGVRADIAYVQKNHKESRKLVTMDYDVNNSYLLLPVMASFSFGGGKLRGFMNLGVYGGYWLNSRMKGSYCNLNTSLSYDVDEDIPFSDTRDQRWDSGLVAGAGMEYRFAAHWAAQMEVRHYYSLTSITKDYMRYSDPRYNSTTAFTLGVQYLF